MEGTRHVSIPALIVLALVVPALAQNSAGDLWETTSQMSMEGAPIKLPSNTVKACTFKEWKNPRVPPTNSAGAGHRT